MQIILQLKLLFHIFGVLFYTLDNLMEKLFLSDYFLSLRCCFFFSGGFFFGDYLINDFNFVFSGTTLGVNIFYSCGNELVVYLRGIAKVKSK